MHISISVYCHLCEEFDCSSLKFGQILLFNNNQRLIFVSIVIITIQDVTITNYLIVICSKCFYSISEW